jgi:hypothetical protein
MEKSILMEISRSDLISVNDLSGLFGGISKAVPSVGDIVATISR